MARNVTSKDFKAIDKVLAPKPQLTPEQQLAKINEEASWNFNHLKQDATGKLAGIRERLMDLNHHLSSEIAWTAADILKCEVRLEVVRWFEGMTSPEADKSRSPWEAAVYIYRDLQERLISQGSYYGMELHSCSTEPVSNAMAHHRAKAVADVLRHNLSFVKFHAKQLGINLFFDAED